MRILEQMLLTFLLNASWQVALIVTFALACDWLLRGVAARYRHLLWVATLIACLAVPVLSCARFARETLARQSSATQDSQRPTVTSRILTPGVEIDTRLLEPSEAPLASDWRKTSGVASSISINAKLAMLLAVLYGLLLLWRIVSLFRAWHRTRVILQSAFACNFSDSFQRIVDHCQTVIRPGSYRVFCSDEVPVPITVGVFRRVIILPQRFMHEIDHDVLRSAIGHELVHVARRDYLTNLIYEFIYVPISFHPAAALARRRIKHTRELCCDETVAANLIKPDIYARSLISLIGAAPIWRPLAPDTTIGINESDILEVRIMSLLKTREFSPRRRTLLLVAASLLLLVPCVAAARLALSFDTGSQEPAAKVELQQTQDAEQREKQERMIVELSQQVGALKERMKQAPATERVEIEAKLREVERNLAEHKRALEQSGQAKERTAWGVTQSGDEEARLREEKEKLEEELRLGQKDRKARLIYHTEPEYTPDAREKKIEGSVRLGFTIDPAGVPQNIQIKKSLYPSLDQAAVNAVRTWRFEPAMKNGERVSMWVESELVFKLNDGAQSQEERREKEERDKAQYGGQEYRTRMSSEDERRTKREAEDRNRLELARQARISMDQAIQIATSKTPGKVVECSLVGERWSGAGELAKPSMVLYHVVILSGDDATPIMMHVLVNAADGSIVKTEREERKRENPDINSNRSPEKALNGGVLNGKANSLPQPEYPLIAKQARASGTVTVEVLIDEGGNVVAAHSVSGHPLLQAAAVKAARQAKFDPTRYNGEPVMVRGVITYNFVTQ